MRSMVLILTLCGAAAAEAAGNPSGIDVLVMKAAGGAVAFKGKTDVRGSFATGVLDAGSYIVQFNTRNLAPLKGRQYSIAAVGGKRAITAAGVAGEKFGAGGVAMKVDVAAQSKLTGQVALGEVTAVEGVGSAAAERTRRGKGSSDSLRRVQDAGGQGAAPPDRGVGR